MAGIATVVGVDRAEREGGAQVTDVQVDPGGGANVSAEHFSAAGDDAPPLPGDSAITVPSSGRGKEAVVGYVDPNSEPVAAPGEKRVYARDGDGVLVAEIWLKGDGDLVIKSVTHGVAVRLASDGVHLGDETGAADIPRADRTDAEITRIYDAVANWVPAATPMDGGAAIATQLKAAFAAASGQKQSTASDKVKGT